jgi:hypothetical protein
VSGRNTTAGDFRAQDLADLLAKEIFDAEDAARFLGIERNSIEYAAYRKRIPYVQYGAKKLFTRADLMDYATNRGRGRDSKLQEAQVLVVKS